MTTFSIGLKNRETLAEALDRLDQELPHLSIDYLLGYNLWSDNCIEVLDRAFDQRYGKRSGLDARLEKLEGETSECNRGR